MSWISANWVWILIAIAFVAMHMFGHGGHGGHGGSGDGDRNDERTGRGPSENGQTDRPGGHRH
jgi:hypothetical protein